MGRLRYTRDRDRLRIRAPQTPEFGMVRALISEIWVPEGSLAGCLFGCVFEFWPAPGARESLHKYLKIRGRGPLLSLTPIRTCEGGP